jgi:hypothetical protein
LEIIFHRLLFISLLADNTTLKKVNTHSFLSQFKLALIKSHTMEESIPGGPSPAFIRATIKIAHPDWTAQQIEAELQKKIEELRNPQNSGDCEFCSS